MSTNLIESLEESILNESESELVKSAQRCMMMALDFSKANKIAILSEGEKFVESKTPVMELPPKVIKMIAKMLGAMVENKPIFLIPQGHLFTTIEAAQFLNVSRPFVSKLLKNKQIPCVLIGTHRRIAYEDLVTYKNKMRNHQEEILQKMAEQAQDLGMGY